MHRASSPRAPGVRHQPAVIECLGDLAFAEVLLKEHRVDGADDLDLISGPGHEYDTVGLKALVLASLQQSLCFAALVDELAPKPESRWPTLAVAHLDETALALEHLGRELSAVLTGHRPLHAFDDGRDRTAIVLELFGAVDELQTSALQLVFVVSALVGVLKSPPATDVIHKDRLEVGVARLNIIEQSLQRVTAFEAKSALSLVGVSAHDLIAARLGVRANQVGLILCRVLLVLRRHTDVLRGPDSWRVCVGCVFLHRGDLRWRECTGSEDG